MTKPFRIQIVSAEEMHIYTESNTIPITQHFLEKNIVAFPQAGYAQVKAPWRQALQALVEYDGDPGQARPTESGLEQRLN